MATGPCLEFVRSLPLPWRGHLVFAEVFWCPAPSQEFSTPACLPHRRWEETVGRLAVGGDHLALPGPGDIVSFPRAPIWGH